MKQIKILLYIGSIVATFFITRHYYSHGTDDSTVISADTTWQQNTISDSQEVENPIPVSATIEIDSSEIFPITYDSTVNVDSLEAIPISYDSLSDLYKRLYLNYNTRKTYSLNFPIDTLDVKGSFNMQADVFNNNLSNVKFGYTLLTKNMVVNSVVVKNSWYIYGKTDLKSIDLGVARTQGNYIFTATYNPMYSTFSIGMGYNIRKLW